MTILTKKDFLFLLSSENYCVFLKRYFSIIIKDGKYSSISHISRVAGFKSRSTISDLLGGRREISPEVWGILKKLILLPKEYIELIEAMIHKQHPKKFRARNPHLSDLKIKSLKEKINEIYFIDELIIDSEFFYKHNLATFYAALGGDQGSSIYEVSKRTKKTKFETRNAMNQLISLGIVIENNEKYKANAHCLKFSALNGENYIEYISSHFQKISEKAKKRMNNPDHFFSISAFSMDIEKTVELKQEINELIDRFIEKNEKPEGNRVFTMGFSLIPEDE